MAKAPANIKSLARKHTTEAIDRLVYWMRSDDARASVKAAESLLDRGWGKASQPLTGADDGPLQIEHLSAREKLLDIVNSISKRERATTDYSGTTH